MEVPIILCLVLLDVYFNWPLESLKSDKKWESYGHNMKTGRNRKTRTGCTGTPLMCTGTHWPKMTRTQSVPVHVQSVPVHITRKCPECVFSPLFHALSSMDHSYTSNTHQNHFKFLLESLFYSIHLSISYLSSKFFHEFLPKPF